jgi:hypothetical protein
MFGTSHLQYYREGAAKEIVKDAHELLNGAINLINNKATGPIYGSGFTTLPGGIPPGMKQNMNPGVDLAKQAVKGTIKEFGGLISKVINSQGAERDKAIGALGFEAVLLFFPGGEETKAITVVPRGFKSVEQFAQVGKELTVALEKSGIKYEQIGITGSAVTGVSSKGGPFREEATNAFKASDIDAFVVLAEDIPVTGGAKRPEFIHPDKMMKAYPALKEWSEKWSKILKREITTAAIKPAPKATK